MNPLLVVLGAGTLLGLGLLGIGFWLEWGRVSSGRPERFVVHPLTMDTPRVSTVWRARWRVAVAQHPARWLAVLETIWWLVVAVTIVMHLLDTRDGPVAYVIWALAIGPHEAGHVICVPFGRFMTIAGGSIWQILVFALPAAYYFGVRRQITGPLIFLALTGHNFIDLAVYIGDARARKLPLIMGMSSDHHDWWNLLRELNLLKYDHVLALFAEMIGVGLILLACGTGILTAWLIPRSRLGATPRFQGSFWRALRGETQPESESI